MFTLACVVVSLLIIATITSGPGGDGFAGGW